MGNLTGDVRTGIATPPLPSPSPSFNALHFFKPVQSSVLQKTFLSLQGFIDDHIPDYFRTIYLNAQYTT